MSQIPLRDFAFSGSQKLKSPLASQGRRLKAGVAKDLGGVHPEARDVAVTVHPSAGAFYRTRTPRGTTRHGPTHTTLNHDIHHSRQMSRFSNLPFILSNIQKQMTHHYVSESLHEPSGLACSTDDAEGNRKGVG
jgi:hypothetical protein